MTSIAIADGLFVDGPTAHLIAGREHQSGRMVFPFPQGIEAENYAPVDVAPEGTLWSWTVQRFRPKSPPYAGPEAFEPYAVGYVEFPGQLIVEGRLTGVALDAIRIGDRYRTVVVPFVEAADGTVRTTYAFEPVGGASA
jgi:uncharacterized OB-fold protein